jgi:RsiW-degrading membrane proteinase PrsW (M82 family)
MDEEQTPLVQQHAIIPVHKPDSREYLFYFLSGIVISIPFTVFYETYTDQFCFMLPIFAAEMCSTAIFAPFIEEFAKAYPLFYRHGETQRTYVNLGFLTGLGFGLTEFFLYIFVYNAPVLLRIPGLFFHAASTTIVAFGIATRKPIQYYLIAVFLHFSNNFFALLGDFWYIGGPLVLILTYVLAYYLYKQTKDVIVDNIPVHPSPVS